MITQGDIAAKLNISRTTVARAFSGQNVSMKTRQQVLALAKEMGYIHNSAASSLPARGRKQVYAFIISTIDEGYSSQMEDGIREITKMWNGYNFTVQIIRTDIKQPGDQCTAQLALFYDTVRNNEVDGVILSALNSSNLEAVTEYCQKHAIPLMTLDLIEKGSGLCHVGVNYSELGAQSASLLANLLSKAGKILVLNYDDGYGLSRTRMSGFYDKLAHFPHISWSEIVVSDIRYTTYMKALREQLQNYDPDAIYAPYKMDHVVRAVRELGITKEYRMISNGINLDVEGYLRDDKITAIVSARPYYIGAVAANNFFRYFYRQTEVQKNEIKVPCAIYMKENYSGTQDIF